MALDRADGVDSGISLPGGDFVYARKDGGLRWTWAPALTAWRLIHDFDGANSTTAVPNALTGQIGRADRGTWGITNGRAYVPDGVDYRFLTWDIGGVRQYAECVAVDTPGGNRFPAVVARYADNQHHYRTEGNSLGQISLLRVSASGQSTLVSTSNGAYVGGDRLGIEVVEAVDGGGTLNTRLRAYRNDTVVLTYFDTSAEALKGGTRVGLRHGISPGTGPVLFDNMRARLVA